MKTVAVGLSGGVDSTLAALLLKEQGYRVIGLSMSIYNKDLPVTQVAGKACYGPVEKQDIRDVQKWGRENGIETHILDLSETYKQKILSYFKKSYLAGITPNPCVMCNTLMKFGLLLDEARIQGITFDFFATGHYARIQENQGHFILQRGLDIRKDQSYFLYRLSQEQLAQILFPLGQYTKDEVRQMARDRGLQVADKADSQDFYAGDYADLLGHEPQVGSIILTNGKKIGEHNGFWHYTIGQRKGLGVSYSEPLYVVDIDATHNRVIVGSAHDVFSNECHVDQVVWGGLINKLNSTKQVQAKYRSAGQAVPAEIIPEENKILVRFQKPQKAITRGQSIVFYDGDNVIAGGIII